MSILLSFALNNFQGFALAAPLNSTTDHLISWQPQPNVRGTWSILCSCTITLILAVYTVIHPNVSHASQTFRQTWWKLPRLVCLGFFLPEWMFCVALAQWTEARRLSADLRILQEQLQKRNRLLEPEGEAKDDDSAVLAILQSWTLKHSFFVAMGGLQFPPNAAVKDEDASLSRSILTPAGFVSLLKNGYGHLLLMISITDIDDRSKADNLAKLLCFVQVSWFVLQLWARIIDHLAITLLEVYTFINLIWVLAMYGFWMYKPRKIRQPLYLDPKGLEIWLFVGSGLTQREWRWLLNCGLGLTHSQERCDRFPAHPSVVELEADKCYYCSDLPDHYKEINHHKTEKQGLYLKSDVETPICEIVSDMNSNFESCSHVVYVMREETENLELTCSCAEGGHGHYDSAEEREAAINNKKLELIHVNKEKLEILLRVWHLTNRDDLLHSISQSKLSDTNPTQESDHWVLRQESSMFKEEYCHNFGNMFAFLFVLSAYGGVHTSLWHYHFPSTRERDEWRTSSVIIAALPGVLVVVGVLGFAIFGGCTLGTVGRRITNGHRFERGLQRLVKLVSTVLGSFAFVFVAQLYGKRFMLILEAFWSLSNQPDDAYKTPNWTQWIPHL